MIIGHQIAESPDLQHCMSHPVVKVLRLSEELQSAATSRSPLFGTHRDHMAEVNCRMVRTARCSTGLLGVQALRTLSLRSMESSNTNRISGVSRRLISLPMCFLAYLRARLA